MKASEKSAGSPGNKRTKRLEISPLLRYAARQSFNLGVEVPDYLLPETKVGKFELVHIQHKKDEVLEVIDSRMSLFCELPLASFKLRQNWTEMILKSNGERYRSTNLIDNFGHKYAVDHAHGDVLICGLGIGFILHSLRANTNVNSITCVEPDVDLIGLLSKHFPNVVFVSEDFHKYLDDSDNTAKYDFVYLDADSDSVGYFYGEVIPFRSKAKQVLKLMTSRNDLVCWMEDVMRGQIIQNIMGEIKTGFDIGMLSPKEVTQLQGVEPIEMDYFARFGVVAKDNHTLANVTRFVQEWEYE